MHRGFTLIELMIALAIIAILTAIAVPNYQTYMIKTHRATAGACLMELSQFMERFYTVNMRYDKTTAGVDVALPTTQCRTDLADHYTFGFKAAATSKAYTLQAVPKGAQGTGDPLKCGTLEINQAGQKAAGGDVKACWR